MQTIMAYDQVYGAMVTALLYLARSTIVSVAGTAWGIEQTSFNCVLSWGPTNLWLITILLYPGRFLACLAILMRLVVCSTNAHEQHSETDYADTIRHYQKSRLPMSSLRSKRPSAKLKLSGYLATCDVKAKSTRLSLPNEGLY